MTNKNPVDGTKNLKPIKKGELSKELAKERGSKGGKKKAENEKARKSIKEALEIALEIMTEKSINEAKEKKLPSHTLKILENSGFIPYKFMQLLTNKLVRSETKVRIMQEILDRTEGKSPQKIENSGTMTTKFVYVDKKVKKAHKKHIYDVIGEKMPEKT